MQIINQVKYQQLLSNYSIIFRILIRKITLEDMSKTAINFNNKNFIKLKPQNVKLISPISKNQQKQNLRDLIMDYIVHNLYHENGTKQKDKITKKRIPTRLKKVPFTLNVQVNGKHKQLIIDGLSILEKYIEYQKKNIYRQNNIQPLIIDILNFFNEMQQKADQIQFQVDEDSVQTSVVNILLEKFHKDKQKVNRMIDYENINSREKNIAKYTRVSYLDIQNNLQKKSCQYLVQKSKESHRVSRDTISQLQRDSVASTNHSKSIMPSKSKLKDFVQKYKIFNYPQKIQELKTQKLLQTYSISLGQFATKKYEQKQKRQGLIKNNDRYDMQCLKFLDQWICQISLSQSLYKNKFQAKAKQQAAKNYQMHNNVKNQRIQQQDSQSQQECQ